MYGSSNNVGGDMEDCDAEEEEEVEEGEGDRDRGDGRLVLRFRGASRSCLGPSCWDRSSSSLLWLSRNVWSLICLIISMKLTPGCCSGDRTVCCSPGKLISGALFSRSGMSRGC